MRRQLATLGALGLAMALTPCAQAQLPTLPAHVDSGRMVRMHTATTMTRGRLLAPFRAGDSLLQYCRYPGSPCMGREDSLAVRTTRISDLTRLDVSPGTQWRRGALIGGVLGGLIGAVGNAFLFSFCEYECEGKKTAVIALGGIGGAITLGGLGALWGSAFPRWESPW